MYGDYVFGLMGLLVSCGLGGNVKSVILYGLFVLEDYF